MSLRKLLVCSFALGAIGWLQPALHAEEEYESPPTLRAADVVPADLVQGDHYKVLPEVSNDGFMNTYVIESDYGEFEAQGMSLLKIRAREIGALAQLEELSKTEVFAKAALEAGLSPVNAIIDFSQHPIETITGIPGGIARMFSRYSRRAKEGVEQTKELVASEDEASEAAGAESSEEDEEEQSAATQLTESYFGVSGAERNWHQQFGTDPYTSNETLQSAIKSVAWADRLGRFSLRFASLPAVPGADVVGEASDLVWSKDPYELEDYNRGILGAAGVDEALADEFFAQKWLSPSLQTTLIGALAAMEGVEGREAVVSRAAEVESRAEARLVLESTLLLVGYHESRAPLGRIFAGRPIPSAIDRDGKAIVAVALDHVVWTEQGEEAAQRYADMLKDAGAGGVECWFSGGASDKARARLEKRLCTVNTNADQLLVANAED